MFAPINSVRAWSSECLAAVARDVRRVWEVLRSRFEMASGVGLVGGG